MNSVELLTQRERECLSLVDRHFSSKQIARELGMSKNSVDTYCDRARKKLGVTDRYTAARLLRDAGADAVLIASGHDTVRTDIPAQSWLDELAATGGPDGSAAEIRKQGGHRPGASPEARDRRLRVEVAGAGETGRDTSELLLVPAGATTRRSLGDARPGGHGAASGFGHAQTGALQAGGNGLAGNSLPDLGSAGRELQGRAGGWRRRNDLSPAARLGAIVGIAVVTAIAFGGMLAGLHALGDLAHNLPQV